MDTEVHALAIPTTPPSSPPNLIPLAGARPQRKRKATEALPAAPPAPPVRAVNGRYLLLKTVLEFLLTLVLLVLATPVILVTALIVKLTSRGPAFYTQVRVGRGGRLFTILKLRTMMHDCESLTGPRWAIRGDPRITTLGQVLRATHLDELPQLVNVLRGDMALIGPRPERPEFVCQLERLLPDYSRRLVVRPGVTGLAQVQLGGDTDIASVRRKLMYDLHYVEHLSLWMDVRIFAATAVHALGNPLRLIQRLRLVPGGIAVEGTKPWVHHSESEDETMAA
jgi:lipopolysaccharide/colanic/teichoic acid biosynthesis glycosyltransferase